MSEVLVGEICRGGGGGEVQSGGAGAKVEGGGVEAGVSGQGRVLEGEEEEEVRAEQTDGGKKGKE